MDFLKAEIASQKRKVSPLDEGAAPVKKYMRKADIERMQREEEQRQLDEKKKEREKKLWQNAKKVAAAEEASGSSIAVTTNRESTDGSNGQTQLELVEAAKPEAFNISNNEAIRRLRAKGQPIRLFCESDKERRLRLRALELIEERNTEGGRNDLMRALEGMEKGLDLEELQRRAGTSNPALNRVKGTDSAAGSREGSASPGLPSDGAESDAVEEDGKKGIDKDELVDLSLVKTNASKVYPQIYFAIKKVVKEWEQSMAERPDHVKRSQQGKLALATQIQSAEYLKPLFKSLRKRSLAPDVLLALAEITHYMQVREYLKANDAYLRLSIGNAPWPIGVTAVGIHARSAREKIFSNSVAHVLNDEVSRKYIQSLKRVLTFAQAVRPPADLAMKMG